MQENTSTLLLVDDNPKNLNVLSDMLDNKGYEILFALDGIAALERAAMVKPNLILLDVMMPEIDGFETCQRLKSDESTRDIPVIFMTALTDTENKVKGFAAGAVDYITKPIEPEEVLSRVRTHLTIQNLQAELRDKNALLADRAVHLEAEVAERTEQLKGALNMIKSASLDTIFRLSMAAEYKDEDTGEHTKRIGHYSAAIARKLGLKEKAEEAILYAAPMHDVGKIGIPDRILLKPGKLTPSEWEVMKQHAEIGGKILEGSEANYIQMARTAAITHHEKWDGSGYPKGLTGDNIPLVGRIVAVVDVFDALMSNRPYKKAFSLEQSLSIIKEGKGKHFDPNIVEVFHEILDEILEIREKFKDQPHEPAEANDEGLEKMR